VTFRGRSILGAPEGELERIRGAQIAIVFQDALAALNPVHTVGKQVAEAITVHQKVSDREVRERVIELLDVVGIPNPEARADRTPTSLGRMRQRAMIARRQPTTPTC
jgi:ABC-type microcin C transport system duplicated ATPase subunit YejF